MKLELLLNDIADPKIRENFSRIQQYLGLQSILSSGFVFFEVALKGGTKIPVAHGLNFIPKDIIVTSVLGHQFFYFNYKDFDRKNIYITTQGDTTVRFFVGSYDVSAYASKVKKDPKFVAPDTPATP